MSDISALVAKLALNGEKAKAVEASLSKFGGLKESEKEGARAAAIAEVFPLVFGDEASIEGEHSKYEELKAHPWSTNCHLTPKCIVTPRTPEEVAHILELCTFLETKFSIRGQGRLMNPGFTSNDGGVVIFLNNFNDVTCNEDRTIASIGAGTTWLQVYKALEEKYDCAVTGGRVPHVGVPGLLLGGGLSFQNSEQSFSCMGVVNYQIVLADGRIVNANAKENADLWWALKGGFSNFGVVTRFDMSTTSNKVWAEAKLVAPTENGKLLDALMEYHEACEKDPLASLIWMAMDQATLLVFFYCAPVEKPDAFKAFYDIPSIAHVIPPSISTVFGVVQAVSVVLAAEPLSHDMRTFSSLPDLEVYKVGDECRKKQLEKLKGVEGCQLTFVIQPLATGAINACHARGGNPFGLKAQNHQWFLIMADWKRHEDEELVRGCIKEIQETMEAVAKKNGTFLPFRYGNYCSRDQNPLASYGPTNLQKLKDIAAKYDPQQIFQTLQAGGWLVSKA